MTPLRQWHRKARHLIQLSSFARSISANLNSENVRKQFLDFYTQNHGHQYVHSSPVILNNDKSLLFVNAGMNQVSLNICPPLKDTTQGLTCIN